MSGPYKPINGDSGWLRPRWLITFLILAIIISLECYQIYIFQQETYPEESTIEIIVTTDFGENTLLFESISYAPGISAMDALKSVADVETIYGGGFVYSINGVKSTYNYGQGEPKDWFYYINGMLTTVGALELRMQAGDIMRWDFHDWSLERMTTCIVGEYPEPFVHGYGGRVPKVLIVYERRFNETAKSLAENLSSYNVQVELRETNTLDDDEKKHANLILIGTFRTGMIAELNSVYERMGWFFHYSENQVTFYSYKGDVSMTLNNCGVIAATQNPWNEKGVWNGENVVWICTGVIDKDVRDSVNILIKSPETLSNAFSVAVIGNEICKVP